jgi:hypothetical protein
MIELPVELQWHILTYLKPDEISLISSVNQKMAEIVNRILTNKQYWEGAVGNIIDLKAFDQTRPISSQFFRVFEAMKKMHFLKKPEEKFTVRDLEYLIALYSRESMALKKIGVPIKINKAFRKERPELETCLLSQNKEIISFEEHLLKAVKLDSPVLVRFLLNHAPVGAAIPQDVFDIAYSKKPDIFEMLIIYSDTHRESNKTPVEFSLTKLVEEGHSSSVNLLLKSRSFSQNYLNSLLLTALKRPDIVSQNIIKVLLSHGADPTFRDPKGYPVIIWVILGPKATDGKIEKEEDIIPLLKILLEFNKEIIDQTDPYDRTALMISIEQGNPTIAQFLIDKGANVNAKNVKGKKSLNTLKREI